MPTAAPDQGAPDQGAPGQDFAAAAGPFAGDTVRRTGTAGLHAGSTTIQVADLAMPAYVARPEQGSELPVVLVLPEAFGLHEHIADIARRFAHEGYLAVAPDLMVRQGDPQSYPDVDALVTGLLQRIPDEQVMGDLDAIAAWAVSHGGARDRVAVCGFCWGGRWTWLYAAHAQVAAAVAWYGILDGAGSGMYPDTALFPTHPLDVADRLTTPVLGLYGGRDEAIPLPTVEGMRTALAARPAGAPEAELLVFPDAGHAFHADYRESYSQPDAERGWERTLAWLARHGA